MKIVQIDGIKGMITAAFICVCAFAGFVVFPGYVAMGLWNKYLVQGYMFPSLSLFQGILLWAIAAIVYFIIDNKGFALSFRSTPDLSDEELNSILKSAKLNSKMRMFNDVISRSDKFIKNPDEKSQTGSVKKEETFISSPLGTKKKNEEKDPDSVTHIK